jgi:hypothetical protein
MMRRNPTLLQHIGVLAAVFGSTSEASQEYVPLADVISWEGELLFQESESALNAAPSFRLDPAGGFLAIDPRESQVRLYREDGTLKGFFGRKGEGPGEFRRLRDAVRIGSGEICAFDWDGRMSVWSNDGSMLLRDVPTGLRMVSGAAETGDSRVFLFTVPNVTVPTRLDAPTVHVLNVGPDSILQEILPLPLTEENVLSAMTVLGGVEPPSRNSLNVTWPVFDSLWVVDLADPPSVRALRIESSLLSENGPIIDRERDPEGFTEFMNSNAFVLGAYGAPGGGWIVELTTRRREGPKYSLVRIDAQGRKVWEVLGTPKLEVVDAERGHLYFAEETGLVPNKVRIAHLRK